MTESNGPVAAAAGPLLGPVEIRELARRAGIRPTKSLGQNFVTDGGTVRKIVRQAAITPGERVVEIGPGLGSLTLGLLEAGADLVAVEIDPVLAGLLPETIRRHVPNAVVQTMDLHEVDSATQNMAAHRNSESVGSLSLDSLPAPGRTLTLVRGDALDVRSLPGSPPTVLVANLPYNVSVPVLLNFLEHFPTVERVLVMVQAEVADRLAAPPGSRTYGVPSAKAAWYATVRRTATVGRTVFWPVPRVDSALIRLDRREPPVTSATRDQVFTVVDAAFAQRRKMLRAALSSLTGDSASAARAIEAAGIDPAARGEALDIVALARVAEKLPPEALRLGPRSEPGIHHFVTQNDSDRT